MCGIAGILVSHGNLPQQITNDDFQRVLSLIYHRGPDEDGIYESRNIIMGMRRLQIIDLETGKQPIHNEDKTVWIVFNGEIYNFKELRNGLISRGHTFYTKSDTETIVHLYEEMGSECVKELRGMFAFAIWDEREKKLFLTRDRMGIKPLYYTFTKDYFIFGSELKCILAVNGIQKDIDLTALSDYFSFLYVPAPRTIFKNIYKLPPAHYIEVKDNNININKYWNLFFTEDVVLSEEKYIQKALHLIRDAVKFEMISDVPIGAFLSGGVDSSIIVAIMSQLSDYPVETFSIGYRGNDWHFDERYYADIVAKKYKTNHHEFIVKPNVIDILENIVRHFDEPFADASAIPNYLISKETKNFVTVALSGLGGDELCAGYERYAGAVIADKYKNLPNFMTNIVFPKFIKLLPDSKSGSHFQERLKRFIRNAIYEPSEMYFNIFAKFNQREKGQLFIPDISQKIEHSSFELFDSLFHNYHNLHIINKMIATDINSYLHDDLLTLTDRMSMAHSLEVRVPLLDYKLVEFFATIPPQLKLKGITKKYLLKKLAEGLLPKEVIYRKKKGFSVPLVLWFRNELKDYLHATLSKKTLEHIGYFSWPYISKIIDEHIQCKANHDEKLWALVNFVQWHKMYM
jgi:asparagine synthase (glutamine-hydrolysing)